jgi:hypothetical protein
VDSDHVPDAVNASDNLLSIIDTEVVQPCLRISFRAGELRSCTTAKANDTLDSSIEVRLETSVGDVQSLAVWQPDVELLSTVAGMRRNLLRQLEYWLPESRLRWGQEVKLHIPEGWE